MEIITSHVNLDFDGLAAMIAASKIYPKAKMVLPNKVSSSVKEFLALYRDVFSFYSIADISLDEVTQIIIVDTNSSERLWGIMDRISNQTKIIVWDHHPVASDHLLAKEEVIQNVGAATTLLVEKIKKRKIVLTSFEATTLALGIYFDTGSLTFSTTTARDVYAVAFLIEQGANLGVLSRFLETPLTEEQQELLENLLDNMNTFSCKGVKVALSFYQSKKYIDGLSLLAHKLIELIGIEILLLAVEMAGKVFLIGRSSSDSLDISEIMKKFNGGGHHSAAAAVIKNGDLQEIFKKMKEEVKVKITPTVIAENIMSKPVKTVLPEINIKSVANIMTRYGHTGLPVVKDGKLLGIISRRDTDKALHHGLGHAPVKAFMSKDVKTISLKTSLTEIEELMIQNNIGRLPVLHNNKIVGIVTRSDVLKQIYGENINKTKKFRECQLKKADIKRKMASELQPQVYKVLLQLSKIAEETDTNVYLVGGVVRDLFLNRVNDDLDIVVEGEGIKFAEKVAQYFGVDLKKHDKFGTSTVEINDNLKIDIVTARSEYYAYPAALPQVEKAFLRQDLDRRDFTINAMAISLRDEQFGTLIDYYCGFSDLQKKIIRVIHNLSFVEDPTRILRAVRFESRLGFIIESHTKSLLIQSAKEIEKVSKPRIGYELRFILKEENAYHSILRLQDLNVLKYILGQPLNNKELLKKVYEILPITEKEGINLKKYLLYLGVLFVDSEQSMQSIYDLGLYKEEKSFLDMIVDTLTMKKIFAQLPENEGDMHRYLKNFTSECCIFILLFLKLDHLIDKMILYLNKRQKMKPLIKGADLQKISLKPGPLYSKIFMDLEVALLNGEVINNRNEEINWVKEKYL